MAEKQISLREMFPNSQESSTISREVLRWIFTPNIYRLNFNRTQQIVARYEGLGAMYDIIETLATNNLGYARIRNWRKPETEKGLQKHLERMDKRIENRKKRITNNLIEALIRDLNKYERSKNYVLKRLNEIIASAKIKNNLLKSYEQQLNAYKQLYETEKFLRENSH